jgi:redox-regulated HSP33 family molecular chaperone
MLDAEDILALLTEGEAVVDGHICHARYEFDREELEDVLRELETPG